MFTEGLDPTALQWVRQAYTYPGEAEGASSADNDPEDSDGFSAESSSGSFHMPLNPSIWAPVAAGDDTFVAPQQQNHQESAPESPPEKWGSISADGRVLSPTAPPIVDMDSSAKEATQPLMPSSVNELNLSSDHWTFPVVESFRCDFERDQSERVESSVPIDQPVESSEVNGYGSTNQSMDNAGPQRTRDPVEKQAPFIFLSGQASWQAIIAYDACVRLCLRAWSRGCVEAPEFLQDECLLLRTSFGLQQVLLQPKGEHARNGLHDDADSSSASKPKTNVGKVKVQVRKVKLMMRMPSGCQFPPFAGSFTSIYSDARRSNKRCTLLSGWAAVRKIRVLPRQPLRSNSTSMHATSIHANAYLNAGAQYMKQVSGLLKAGVNTLRSSSLLESQDAYFCVLKLRSSSENESVRVQPGCADIAVFHPDVTADELLVEVYDSRGPLLGRSNVPLSPTDDSNERVRWWPIYSEPDRECLGKVQLFLCYTTTSSELGPGKWGAVGETVAYDIVLDAAMKVHKFGRRNLRLHGSWQWLLSEFAVCYGVSDIYSKLRYLACVMDVATPTEDCLSLVYELLVPIINARDENELSRQEKRIFADVEDQVTQLLSLVFENYKSLDELSVSGFSEIFQPGSGVAAPSLVPAVQVFTLLNDILSSEAQGTLRNYFQTAARKRCKRLMVETDEFVASTNEGFLLDPMSISTAYLKMKNLCAIISTEISTDIEIHSRHVLPSSIDLPNITASIYNVEVCNRLRSFLVACPPSSPSPPVADLLIAAADFQRDMASWGIKSVKGGVDAKDLFHLYIVLWIQEKRLQLLEFCKFDKVRLAGVTTQHGTAPFVEEVYERMKETLNEYEVIISRWPEYTFVLENAVADVERAVITALEKHYADVLGPLKEVMEPKKFTLQYMQKLARRRSLTLYSVPNQLGVVLNTIKRLLDTMRPKLDAQMKSWVVCLPVDGGAHGKAVYGERLNEVAVALRTKYRSLLQAIVEKLADNARMHPSTKLKKILQDTREAAVDSEMRERMQHLITQILETIAHLHEVFTTRVFVAVTRGYWDRMARDVLRFLENRKENRSCYKSSCFALGVLDDIFASQMQRLQGHCLTEKDLEPPRSVMEARSMLSKDFRNGLDSSSYLF